MDGVFAPAPGGGLRLAADWDALYRSHPDPWAQSGEDDLLGPYYRESRARLTRAVRRNVAGVTFRGLEVGSGHGQVVGELGRAFPYAQWAGLEVSMVAAVKARQAWPRHLFHVGDLCTWSSSRIGTYGVVILGQVWWYVLERIDAAIGNALALLEEDGVLIVSQAFLATEQRYGKHIADGFAGALMLLDGRFAGKIRLLEAEYEASGRFVHFDGLMVFRKQMSDAR